uniref:V-type proton ATPase subunit S1/VOA1 transmembrane domain-containing protein n=1 Tax=Glossina brevipalpis TaxID=37001 RepID=A0A1A9WZQ9_9MUSC
MFKIHFLIILSLEIILIRGDDVPVLIWNATVAERSALQVIPTKEFQSIINPLLRNNTVVIFLENQLTSRDFQCRVDGVTCFPFMQSRSNKTYMTVKNPLEALEPYMVSEAKASPIVRCQKGMKYVINFDDSLTSNDRKSDLKLHDSIILNITRQLDRCSVLYMYTAQSASALQKTQPRRKRGKRQSEVRKMGESSFFFDDKFGLTYEKFLIKTEDGFENINIETIDVSADASQMSIDASADEHEVQILFTIEGGYHTLKHVEIDNIKYRARGIQIPKDFSYVCGVLYLYSNDLKKFAKLERFQMEIFKKKTDKFSPAWYCVGYFTAPIMAGIISMAVLLAILTCGIVWIMDVGVVDRFDDPFGKTIVIIADD